MTENSTILITGAAGFIGSHVTRALLSMEQFCNARVIVLDDLSGGFEKNIPDDERVFFVQGSITDSQLIDRLFEEYQFDYIYHLAAYAAEGLSHFIRRFNYTNNLIGSVNLLNAAIRYESQCFVFTSSIAVYGKGQLPLTEETVPQPEDPYGIAKYAFEMDLQAAYEMFGLKYVIFRPHNVYGEYQNIADKYRNVVGIFMNRLLQGLPMPIFGDGEQQRAFTYIGDIAGMIASSAFVEDAQNQIFNVGADHPCSVNELAKLVAESLGLPEKIERLDARQEVKFAYSDHSKAENVFGKQQETSLREGLNKMAQWVRQAGIRESVEFSDIEVRKNLPASWK